MQKSCKNHAKIIQKSCKNLAKKSCSPKLLIFKKQNSSKILQKSWFLLIFKKQKSSKILQKSCFLLIFKKQNFSKILLSREAGFLSVCDNLQSRLGLRHPSIQIGLFQLRFLIFEWRFIMYRTEKFKTVGI